MSKLEKPLVERLFLLHKKVQVFIEGYGDVPTSSTFYVIWANAD